MLPIGRPRARTAVQVEVVQLQDGVPGGNEETYDFLVQTQVGLSADSGIEGSDPPRLREALRTAGLGTEGTAAPCAAALAIFEVIAGTIITRTALEGRFSVGSAADPYNL